MQSQPSTALSPGSLIAGRYRVEKLLGTGGMGRVFAARHIELDELVAIKVVLPQLEGDTTYVNRLLREGRNAVKIRSEHVARILDVGRVGEGGTPFVVMEYLEGQDLAQILRARGPLPVADACEYLLQACEAVASAHALGIVHRDLKPANLFLIRRADGSPCIKVLDFGICKVLSQSGMALTGNSALLGSPNYVSPEQIVSSSQVDGAADVWSLGVLLFRLLTNRLPFEGNGSFDVMGKILRAAPVGLRALDASLPEDLERTILRCLEKDRSLRLGLAEFAFAVSTHAPPHARVLAERVARLLPPKGGSEALVSTRVPGRSSVDPDEDELVAKVWDSTPPPAAQASAAGSTSWLQAPHGAGQRLPTPVAPSAPQSPKVSKHPTPLPVSDRSRKRAANASDGDLAPSFDGAPTHHGRLVVNNAAPTSVRPPPSLTFAAAPAGAGPSVSPPFPSVAPVTSVLRTGPSTPSNRPPPPSQRPASRRPIVLGAVAIALAALGGVAGAVYWRTTKVLPDVPGAVRAGLPTSPLHSAPTPSPESVEPPPAGLPSTTTSATTEPSSPEPTVGSVRATSSSEPAGSSAPAVPPTGEAGTSVLGTAGSGR